MATNWNVCTLQNTGMGNRRRTALKACALARYDIDIAAQDEDRLTDECSLVEEGTCNTFFLSRLSNDAIRIRGIGFVAKTAFL